MPADANCRLPLREVVTANAASVPDPGAQLLQPAAPGDGPGAVRQAARPVAPPAAHRAGRQRADYAARQGARRSAPQGAPGVARAGVLIVADAHGCAAHAIRG